MVSCSPSLVEGVDDDVGSRSNVPAEDVSVELCPCVFDVGSVDSGHFFLLVGSKVFELCCGFGRLNSDSTWRFEDPLYT